MNQARSRAVDRHTHARLEELFLFDGELWIDDRKLYPGDYNRAEAPSDPTVLNVVRSHGRCGSSRK